MTSVPAVTTHTVPGLPGVTFTRALRLDSHGKRYVEWAFSDETYGWDDWGYYTKTGVMKTARKTRAIFEAEARGEAEMLTPDPADLVDTLPIGANA